MCGIAGCISLESIVLPEDVAVIKKLNDRQRRRGPDGEGLWVSPDRRAVLGQRRLAIIDVGQSGAQPMNDVTGRWSITYNGEIYNYRELRQELEQAGRRFRTQSDTEVLINAVAEWGEEGIRKLRGMYAFALWDNETKELWLARDPFGIKPLYYAHTGSTLWFASQARALAECAPVSSAYRPAGLVGYYLWGSIPDPFTWWRGISALPAGHLLRVVHGKAAPAPVSFSRIEDLYVAAPAEPISSQDLRDAFFDSLSAHLVSDVPVGVFLSSGVDSTAIATVVKEAGVKLNTVTLAFNEYEGTRDDEARQAEETARNLGAEHRTVRVDREEFYSVFDDFLASMDQPTIDGLNTYLVSRAASMIGLKAALSGLGGDELLGGYPSFRQAPKLVSIGRRFPTRARCGELLDWIGRPIAQLFNVTPKIAASLKFSGDIESAYYLRRCLYLPEELEMLVDETWSKRGLEELSLQLPDGDPDRKAHMKRLSPYAAVSQLEVTNYTRMQLLRDTDWASMAHSLEVRVPFIDLRLFAKLAPAIASRSPPSKADFVNCIDPNVSRAASRRKTGFSTPIAKWLAEKAVTSRGLRPWADVVAKSFRRLSADVA